MRNAAKYILFSVMVTMTVLCVGCRRTKICRCDGTLYGKPETLYFNVEHSFHCKDINRAGYERLQDTIFIRSMHNITCDDFEVE
ncbi:MAG: hypothetical protein J5526_07670 [Bacteroidales bacterium]|nr:hypothetical protein [Bacteroidales bacterium]